ncbi:MAG TPA: hypothetical protein VGE77_12025 [Nocardioides sp.]
MTRFFGSWPVAGLIGLLCGVIAMTAMIGRADGGSPSTREDLAAGDILQTALDAFAAGDHVVVAPGSRWIMSEEQEAELETVIAEEAAPLYVLVIGQSWNAGYAQAGHAFDQLQANAEVNGVLALWEEASDRSINGEVGLTGDRRLPSGWALEDLGIVLTPEEQTAYDAIDPYEMLGEPAQLLSTWARALPPGIEDVEPEQPNADTRREDRIFGVVFGVVLGALGGLFLWVGVGVVRVSTGRPFSTKGS